MLKDKQIPSLAFFMAYGSLKSVIRKRLFGGQYVLARDFFAIMAALYEPCALIGRLLKDDLASLAALLTYKTAEGQWVPMLKELVDKRLLRYKAIYSEPPDSFVFLVLATEYAEAGLILPHGNVGSVDAFKHLELGGDKGKVEITNRNMRMRAEMMLGEGFGFGLLYPEMTWDLVSRTQAKFSKSVELNKESWKMFCSIFAIPEGFAPDLPEEAEDRACDLVKMYVQQFRPELAETLNILNSGGFRGNP